MKGYGVNVHGAKSQLIHGEQSNGTTLLLLFFILKSPCMMRPSTMSNFSYHNPH